MTAIVENRVARFIIETQCITERWSSWHCNAVLVADCDCWKAHFLHVFNTYVDDGLVREIVHDAIHDLIRRANCSGDQQQDPDGPSERCYWRIGDEAKPNHRRFGAKRFQFQHPWCFCCSSRHDCALSIDFAGLLTQYSILLRRFGVFIRVLCLVSVHVFAVGYTSVAVICAKRIGHWQN